VRPFQRGSELAKRITFLIVHYISKSKGGGIGDNLEKNFLNTTRAGETKLTLGAVAYRLRGSTVRGRQGKGSTETHQAGFISHPTEKKKQWTKGFMLACGEGGGGGKPEEELQMKKPWEFLKT